MSNVAEIRTESPSKFLTRRLFTAVDGWFLGAAGASFAASVTLWFLVNHSYGLFVGLWVPSILALWVGTRLASLRQRIAD